MTPSIFPDHVTTTRILPAEPVPRNHVQWGFTDRSVSNPDLDRRSESARTLKIVRALVHLAERL